MAMKRQVYLNEYNLPADNNAIFFPYASGLLQAYTQQFGVINYNYEFKPIIFVRDTVEQIVKQYDNPNIIGFSTVLWNYNLSLAVAKRLKENFPKCKIIFGGPQVELNSKIFFIEHPYIDVCVYGEGEKVFHKLLIDNVYNGIPYHKILFEKDDNTDLDEFPSPYTTGIFNELIKLHSNVKFKGLVEYNRNCPFHCAYCFWGQPELGTKVKYHSQQYIKEEIEWLGENKIEYVFGTDANFGMFKRDLDTAKRYVEVKNKYGYPKIFRVCYGKEDNTNIFETASILDNADLAKIVTLSVQSQNKKVLDSVGRKNISKESFTKLQKKYSDAGISTYTEIILGLPNETRQSFLDGLEETLRSVGSNRIFIYQCQVYKNTRLDSEEFRLKYGLITKTRPMSEPHSAVRTKDMIGEFEEIIIGTNTLTVEEWKECAVVSWLVQLLHSFKAGYNTIKWLVSTYNISYMDIYLYLTHSELLLIKVLWNIAEQITQGLPENQVRPMFGTIYYEPEEILYLNICHSPTDFYTKLLGRLQVFINTHKLPYKGYIFSTDLVKMLNLDKKQILLKEETEDWTSFAIKTIIYGGKSK